MGTLRIRPWDLGNYADPHLPGNVAQIHGATGNNGGELQKIMKTSLVTTYPIQKLKTSTPKWAE